MHRPIGFGQMLCTCESHESLQGPGLFDVIATEAGGGWVGDSITGHWSHFTGYTFHYSHAAASLVYFPAFCCHPRMEETEQGSAVPGGSHHTDR